MIKTVSEKTVEAVRERERERERVILTKLCFVNHAKKSNGISVLKNNKYIKGREIGYVDRCKSYV